MTKKSYSDVDHFLAPSLLLALFYSYKMCYLLDTPTFIFDPYAPHTPQELTVAVHCFMNSFDGSDVEHEFPLRD